MAIIVKSPRKRQRVLFWVMSIFVISILLVIFFVAFPPISGRPGIIIDKTQVPEVKINFDILDSDQIRALEPFPDYSLPDDNPGRSQPFSPY